MTAVFYVLWPVHWLYHQLWLFWRRLYVLTSAWYMQRWERRIREQATRMPSDQRAAFITKEHGRLARFARQRALHLQGVWVKLGQFMSTRADMLSEPWLSELSLLQASLPPRPAWEIRRTLEEELGHGHSAFASFDWTPLAVASIAQVHRAQLKDGRDVVVKLRHRGIAEVVNLDLALLGELVESMHTRQPEWDMRSFVEDWCSETRKELDLAHEASNAEVMAGLQAVRVPKVVRSSELGPTCGLLVLEFVEGVRLAEAQHAGQDMAPLLAQLCESYGQQLFQLGLVHADPHPGNLLVAGDQLALLDFGLAKRISGATRRALAQLLVAAHDGDLPGLHGALQDLQLRERFGEDEVALQAVRRVVSEAEPLQPEPLLEEQPRALMKATHSEPGEASADVLLFVLRVVYCLRGLAAEMQVPCPLLRLVYPYARAALCDSPWPQQPSSSLQEELTFLLEKEVSEGQLLGVAVTVFQGGSLLAESVAGREGPASPSKVTAETLFPLLELGEGLVVLLVHSLVEHGHLDLDQPVARYWRSFHCPFKAQITCRQLLERRASLGHGLPSGDLAKWDQMLRLAAGSKPGHPSPLQGWLLGGLVEAAAGLAEDSPSVPLPVLLRERVAEPMKLPVYLMLPRELHTASLSQRQGGCFDARLINVPPLRHALAPSLTARSTARAVATMFMALSDGCCQGRRLLSSRRCNALHKDLHADIEWPAGFRRLGFRGSCPGWGIGFTSQGGSLCFLRPDAEVAVAVLVNEVDLERASVRRILDLLERRLPGLGSLDLPEGTF